MNHYDLFATRVYKTNIDPTSYDKEHIVKTMIDNYNIQPQRNTWDKISRLHHAYDDWENEQFQKVNTDSLYPVYDSVIKQIIDSIKFNHQISYKWSIANLAINSKFMREHDHFYINQEGQSLFSCVHYIKFNKEVHPQTTFINPLPLSYFSANVHKVNSILNSRHVPNSTYFGTWDMDASENDFIAFPSYLKHLVYDSHQDEIKDNRIVAVINVELIY